MAIEQGKVGNVAAGLMQTLEETYGDGAEIDSVLLITAVKHPGGRTTVHYKASPGMPVHEGLGLLQYIRGVLTKQ